MTFRQLFSFSKKEIDRAFKKVRPKAKTRGLKLLQAPGLFFDSPPSIHSAKLSTQDDRAEFGKLLIIAPRRSGKAHKRNLIRRRIRAIFYEQKLYEKVATSILLVRSEAMELTFEQLQEFLVSSLK